ncbi:hypothetical protein CDL15_Pgr009395 [Punica granatum]|uniref:Uncharacterized protein n=1 Tax=Punica granatum TaxID=22663 RepID=A0A218VSW0_PUNGR|nr:hypothetical protein CDL15_Pgr009395 [Punica granatum]
MPGRSPKAVNAGPEPNVGPEPNAVNESLIGKCKKCESKDAWGHAEGCVSDHAVTLSVRKKLVVRGGWPGWTASGHSISRYGEVKTAGGLPAKVGTTRLSCGVGGRAGRPLVIAYLAMEK